MMFRSRHKFCLQILATIGLGAAIAADRLEAKTTTTPSNAGVSTSTKNTPPVKNKTKTAAPTKTNSKVSPLDLPEEPKSATNTANSSSKKAIVPTTTTKKSKSKKTVADATPESTENRANDSNKKPESKPTATTPETAATKANTNTPVNQQEQINLLIKLGEKQVHVFKGEKLIVKYPIAIGKEGWETPVGEWKVMELIRNPGWTNFKNGQVMPPGPENPLGERWIGFWSDGKDSIGFHGTSNVKSIGTAASHGCVRMYNRDVRVLFNLVQVGTQVKVFK
jgi:lipoprotein-anchoring transpeptidase ErfK/SrfK